MKNRLLKQFLYGTFYLVIFAVIGGSIYFAYVKPAPTCADNIKNQNEQEVDCGGLCVSCEIRKLKPLKVLPPQLFDAGNGKTTIVFRVQNPNFNYAAARFIYDVNLFDGGNKRVLFIADESYAYAGAEHMIVLPATDVAFSAVAGSDITAHDPEWVKKEDLPLPAIATREIVVRVEPSGAGVTVTGVAQNNNSYALKDAVVNAIVSDKTGLPIDASKTALASIAPFEERFFSVFIPLSKSELSALDPSRTSVVVEARR